MKTRVLAVGGGMVVLAVVLAACGGDSVDRLLVEQCNAQRDILYGDIFGGSRQLLPTSPLGPVHVIPGSPAQSGRQRTKEQAADILPRLIEYRSNCYDVLIQEEEPLEDSEDTPPPNINILKPWSLDNIDGADRAIARMREIIEVLQ